MSELKKELNEEELSEVSGGWEVGEEFYSYCPFCYGKTKHVICSLWDDLECKTCGNHHKHISSDQGGNPTQWELDLFYAELGYVPENPNNKK